MNLPSERNIKEELIRTSGRERLQLDAMRDHLLEQLDPPNTNSRLPFPLEWIKRHKTYSSAVAACWIVGALFNISIPSTQQPIAFAENSHETRPTANERYDPLAQRKLLDYLLSLHLEPAPKQEQENPIQQKQTPPSAYSPHKPSTQRHVYA